MRTPKTDRRLSTYTKHLRASKKKVADVNVESWGLEASKGALKADHPIFTRARLMRAGLHKLLGRQTQRLEAIELCLSSGITLRGVERKLKGVWYQWRKGATTSQNFDSLDACCENAIRVWGLA